MYVSKESKQVSHNAITIHSTVYMYVSKESKQVSHNAITIHSTVYMYVSKESKQVSRNGIHFMQNHNPNANKSWFELGQEVGLDIIDDEEEEENIQKEEEDKEVVHIFKESKQRHKQMLRGMCRKK